MSFVPNPNVYPPGGYYFIDSKGVKHVGTSWPNLVTKVREFRVQNGIHVGDVVDEINFFTCERFQEGCRDTSSVSVSPSAVSQPASPLTRLSSAVHHWFYRVTKALSDKPVDLEPLQVAQSRADICMKCPKQAPWTVGCGTCAGNAFRLSVGIRKGKDVKYGDNLMGCSVLAEDTRTSVWLPRLEPSTSPDLPAKCWRKAK
jgi:hypothetical protein